MRIINPTFGLASTTPRSAAAGPTSGPNWTRDNIAIISNAKPNARELLEGLKQQLGAFRAVNNVDYHYKDSAAQPAPTALIERIADNYKIAILALAD
jgi:hypothetical protein